MSRSFLVRIFLLKVALSFLYGYIHYLNGWNDTFGFFNASKMAAEMWPQHPWKFLRFIFGPTMSENLPPAYQKAAGVEAIPYYGLQRSGFIVRANSLIQIFSFGYYSVHCVFFAFLSLIGIFHIYRFFESHLRKKKLLFIVFLFFTPSILYWASGAHKDSLIILGIGIMLYTLSKFLSTNKPWWFILFIVACYYSFLARNYTFLLFLPAITAYVLSKKIHQHPLLSYGVVYLLGIILFFGGKFIHPQFNFPQRFIEVQSHFLSLNGGSNFSLEPLKPTLISFIKATPQAFYNIIVKPNLDNTHTFLSTLSVIENIILVFCAVYILLSSSFRKMNKEQMRLALFCFSFAVTFYLLLGLTVRNVGAIVRYKTTGLIFMGIGLLFLLDTDKLPTPLQKFLTSRQTIFS